MKKKVHMLIGCPSSGKSWACAQLKEKFTHVAHDDFIKAPTSYVNAILKIAQSSQKPLLIEAPFSISQTKEPLEAAGLEVKPWFIIEKPDVLIDRYQKREGRPIPQGHLSRQLTYEERAKEMNAFKGTSSEVLAKLKEEL
jgi:hypothetical protein